MEVLAYTSERTERVQYAFDLLFQDILEVGIKLVTDRDEFSAYQGPKVNYTSEYSEEGVWIPPVGLLFEDDIREVEPELFEWNGHPVFFRVDEPKATFPFDPFAASFFLVTRYEEYLPYEADRYGRFPAHESFAYKNGFLEEPVVDRWALWIKEALLHRYPSSSFPERKYRFISTIDVDSAFAYKNKGLVRNGGGFLRALMQLDMEGIRRRSLVLARLQKDPFDTFQYQYRIQQEYEVEAIYFFLLADYGYKDKNVPPSRKSMRSLIRRTAERTKIGAHPSFASNKAPEKLSKEIERLHSITEEKVLRSRQHYLILRIPETYRRLLEHGIQEDYTMGYAAEPGFRAGTTSPFYFFDLEKGGRTDLRVHPFALMDSGLRFYKKENPEGALKIVKKMKEKVEEVGGTFVSVSHNEAMSEWEDWKGWGRFYEKMIQEATSR